MGGRIKVGANFMKVGSKYMRVGPAGSPFTFTIDDFYAGNEYVNNFRFTPLTDNTVEDIFDTDTCDLCLLLVAQVPPLSTPILVPDIGSAPWNLEADVSNGGVRLTLWSVPFASVVFDFGVEQHLINFAGVTDVVAYVGLWTGSATIAEVVTAQGASPLTAVINGAQFATYAMTPRSISVDEPIGSTERLATSVLYAPGLVPHPPRVLTVTGLMNNPTFTSGVGGVIIAVRFA